MKTLALLFVAILASAQTQITQTTLAITNDTATGTHANRLAVLSGGNAITASTTNSTGILGIVVAGAGNSGMASIAQTGQHACDFDGPTTAGDYVIPSTITGGMCHDTGSSAYPATAVSVVGRVVSTGGTLVYVLPGAPVAATASSSSNASEINSAAIPPSAPCLVTNASSQLVAGACVTLSASSYNTGNNGIANAVAACPAAPTRCYIDVPPGYTGTDVATGFSTDFTSSDVSALPSNVTVRDYRNGFVQFSSDACAYSFSNQCSSIVQQGVFSASQPNKNVGKRLFKDSILAGGFFQTATVSNFQPETHFMYAKTQGQIIGPSTDIEAYAPSDALSGGQSVNCLGGVGYVAFAEGCEWSDQLVMEGAGNGVGTVEFNAPVTSTGTGLTTLTVGAPTQGALTLAESRWMTSNNASQSTANTMPAVTCVTGSPCVATLGTAVTASGFTGTVATAVSAGTQTVTPTQATGSVSAFTVGGIACAADPTSEPEMAAITAQSGSTVSIAFAFPHAAGFYLATGGLCGTIMELNADRITQATHPKTEIPISGYSVTGTKHRAFMVIGSPTTTSAQVAVMGKGAWQAIPGNSMWTATNNAVTLWKAAKVAAISTTPGQDAGKSGGQISLAANSVTWTSGDVAQEFLGAAVAMTWGNHNIINLTGNFTSAAGGMGYDFYGVLNGGSMFATNNHSPVSVYSLYGGGYTIPTSNYSLTGPATYGINQQYPGELADDVVYNCFASTHINIPAGSVGGCMNTDHPHDLVTDGAGGAGNDAITINQATGEWGITVKGQTIKYRFLQDGLAIPQMSAVVPADNMSGFGRLHFNSAFNLCWYVAAGTETCSGSGNGNATLLQSIPVSTTTPTTGQAPVYNGTAYVPTSLSTLVNGIGTQANPASGGNVEVDLTPSIFGVGYASDTGSVNALAVTLSPAPTAYYAGMRVYVLPAYVNTSNTPTINVNGLGAKNILEYGTNGPIAGDITTAQVAVLIYDGTEFELQNPYLVSNFATLSLTNNGVSPPYGLYQQSGVGPTINSGYKISFEIANVPALRISSSGIEIAASASLDSGITLSPGSGTITPSAINLGATGAGGITGNLPNSHLATQTANTLMGALTATTPGGIAVPSCPSGALGWTSGTGFVCSSITGGSSTVYTTQSGASYTYASTDANTTVNRNYGGGTMTDTIGSAIPAGQSLTIINSSTYDQDLVTFSSASIVNAGAISAGGSVGLTAGNQLYCFSGGSGAYVCWDTVAYMSAGLSYNIYGAFSFYNAPIMTLGIKPIVTHGTNASSGVAALSGGTVTVSTTSIAALAASGGAGDAIRLTLQTCSSCGTLNVGTVTAGTSFVIHSSNASDASTVLWEIIHVN